MLCEGFLVNGKKCTNKAKKGHTFCGRHFPKFTFVETPTSFPSSFPSKDEEGGEDILTEEEKLKIFNSIDNSEYFSHLFDNLKELNKKDFLNECIKTIKENDIVDTPDKKTYFFNKFFPEYTSYTNKLINKLKNNNSFTIIQFKNKCQLILSKIKFVSTYTEKCTIIKPFLEPFFYKININEYMSIVLNFFNKYVYIEEKYFISECKRIVKEEISKVKIEFLKTTDVIRKIINNCIIDIKNRNTYTDEYYPGYSAKINNRFFCDEIHTIINKSYLFVNNSDLSYKTFCNLINSKIIIELDKLYKTSYNPPPQPPPPPPKPTNVLIAKTPYQILEVNPKASNEEIKKQWRVLMMKYHPDKNPGNIDENTTKTQLINQAYEKIKVIRGI